MPTGGNGTGTVMFSLDAESLAAALAAGVRMLHGIGIAVTGVESTDLVSLKDIAARTGRSYESARLLAAGERGPGGFPAALSTGQWALYSWALVSQWFADHFGGEAAGEFDREIAAADHLLRARHILAADTHRAELAELLTA